MKRRSVYRVYIFTGLAVYFSSPLAKLIMALFVDELTYNLALVFKFIFALAMFLLSVALILKSYGIIENEELSEVSKDVKH